MIKLFFSNASSDKKLGSDPRYYNQLKQKYLMILRSLTVLLLIILFPCVAISLVKDTGTPRSETSIEDHIIFSAPEVKAHIISPDGDIEIQVGESVYFNGYATDGEPPDTYHWDFDGAAPDSHEDRPGDILFDTKGVYLITFTVVDSWEDVAKDTVTIYVGVSMDNDDDDDNGSGGGGCFVNTVSSIQ